MKAGENMEYTEKQNEYINSVDGNAQNKHKGTNAVP